MIKRIVILILMFGFANACMNPVGHEQEPLRTNRMVILSWNKLFLELERYTDGYRSPISGRMFAYISCSAYEAALPAMEHNRSLTTQWVELQQAGVRPWEGRNFVAASSLNAAYASCAAKYFPTAPANLRQKVKDLEASLTLEIARCVPDGNFEGSQQFGRQTAQAFWNWSLTDSVGHDAFLYNYDRSYEPKDCPGCWEPSCERPMPSLLPHWGAARTFMASSKSFEFKPPIPYDETPGSAFYNQAMEVYSMNQPQSKENLWISEFWRDDVDGFTLTSAGRWISIANQVIEQKCPTLETTLETYLRVSMALCDVGITCWIGKYTYNTARPEAYIQQVIDKNWSPMHPAPCFPGYPSGHAAFSSAAASVLARIYGGNIEFTDNTHKGRKEFYSSPRTFHSFKEMAAENALSRITMGVHYRMDCEEGMRLGESIGEKVWDLKLYKSDKNTANLN